MAASGLPTAEELAKKDADKKQPTIFGELTEDIWTLVFKELGGFMRPPAETASLFMKINRSFRKIAVPAIYKRAPFYAVPQIGQLYSDNIKFGGYLGSGIKPPSEYLQVIKFLEVYVFTDLDKPMNQDLADCLRKMPRLVGVSFMDFRQRAPGDIGYSNFLLKHILKHDKVTSFEITRAKPTFHTALSSADKTLSALVTGGKVLTELKLGWIAVDRGILMSLLIMVAPSLEVLELESLQNGAQEDTLLLQDAKMPPMPFLRKLALFALSNPFDYNFIAQVVVKDRLCYFRLEAGQHAVNLTVMKHLINLSANTLTTFRLACQSISYQGWDELFEAMRKLKHLKTLTLVERHGRSQRLMPVLNINNLIDLLAEIGVNVTSLEISMWRCNTQELTRLAKAVPSCLFFDINIDPTWIKVEHTLIALRNLSEVEEIKLCIHMPKIFATGDNVLPSWEIFVKNQPAGSMRLAQSCKYFTDFTITGVPQDGFSDDDGSRTISAFTLAEGVDTGAGIPTARHFKISRKGGKISINSDKLGPA